MSLNPDTTARMIASSRSARIAADNENPRSTTLRREALTYLHEAAEELQHYLGVNDLMRSTEGELDPSEVAECALSDFHDSEMDWDVQPSDEDHELTARAILYASALLSGDAPLDHEDY